MSLKGTGECEFTELVSYHILGYVYGHVLSTVVNGDSVSYEIGEYSGRTAPGLKHV